jgi:microcystin-dependent protein
VAWTSPPKTWVTGEIVDATDMNTHVRDQLNAILPIATVILIAYPYYTAENSYEGRWLQCNGVAVSRTTYAALFAWMNSLSPALPFGSGDGSTTFNVPDLRGRGAWAEGEHAEVDSMGDSDGVAIANRSPSHHHLEDPAPPVGGYSGSGYGANYQAALAKTSGNANLQDKPSYLVVGSYFIKYTA